MKNLTRGVLLHLMEWIDLKADMEHRNEALATAIMLLESFSKDQYDRVTLKDGWSMFFREFGIKYKHE